MAQYQRWQWIPTNLTLEQFEEFVLPHLHKGSRGPQPKLSLHVIFNYILKLLYLGCQWKELPIKNGQDGLPEIHYTRISIAHLSAFKPRGASMPCSRVLCLIFTRKVTSTSASSMAMGRRQRRRKAAITSDSAGTSTSRETKLSLSVIATAM